MASTSDDTDNDANQAFAPAISVEVNDTPQATGAPTDDLPQGDFTAEAQAHWLDGSLAVSAFFTARQYPGELWQLSSFPYLSTRELVDRVLDKKSLRRAMALQIGANIVTHCVPAVANILHREDRQCLCRLPVGDTNTDIVDWLNQQVGLAVPEYQWHAGATPYARVNYLMVLVEEVFRTLPVSWDEAVGQSGDGETVRDALKCIVQAVRSAKLEPQVVLGTWAARNMIPNLHGSEQERLLGSETMDRKSEDNPHALGTSEGDEGAILSPPDSQGAVCRGSYHPYHLASWRLTTVVDVQESIEDETRLVPDTQWEDGDFQDRSREAMSRALQGTLLNILDLTKTNGCRRPIYSQHSSQAEGEKVTSSGA
jgi:hypothetical protein